MTCCAESCVARCASMRRACRPRGCCGRFDRRQHKARLSKGCLSILDRGAALSESGRGRSGRRGANDGMAWRIGADIGGTFIDFCALETRTNRLESLKVLTTPDEPGRELMDGLALLEKLHGVDPA